MSVELKAAKEAEGEKTFDYGQFLAALDVFKVPAHPLPGVEVRLPKWRSKPLQRYNGFSGDERVYMWQMHRWARTSGLYPVPKICAVCGISSNVNVHSEKYADLWNAIPLCYGCHMAIHRRFTAPTAWTHRLTLHTREGSTRWFKLLPLTPIDVAGWLRGRNVPSFLWSNA